MDVEDLIRRSLNLYNLALDVLEAKDYVNACEKAWACIETLRKAILIKSKISPQKAKTVVYGIPLFTRLLKKLRKKDLLEKYTYFNYKLHIMGFYEGITELWEIEEIIQIDLKNWIEQMISLIRELSIDLSPAEEILSEIEKVKRRLIIENAKLVQLREKLGSVIDRAVAL
ncbi:MAG: PaREP1 family protein [Candidatus Njordarchaeota archaeon]